MGLDLVTYLRTEFISAALVTNQTPRSADVCVQIGTEDGRAVNFVPRTIRTLITSSAEADGKLTVSARRQLKQQAERRQAAEVDMVDQCADNLVEVEDNSVDVVISMTAANRMKENGQNWKRSVQEAARVLKPGGRLLFVEPTDIGGESYLSYVQNLFTQFRPAEGSDDAETEEDEEEIPTFPVFDEVGFDEIDFVLVPHIAGVAIKAEDADLSPKEKAEKVANEEMDKAADFSIAALESGIKKRRKKRKKKAAAATEEEGKTT